MKKQVSKCRAIASGTCIYPMAVCRTYGVEKMNTGVFVGAVLKKTIRFFDA
jgi:hypothetical protein